MRLLAVLGFCAKLKWNHGDIPMSNAAVQPTNLMTWLPWAALFCAAFILMKWRRQNRQYDTHRLAQLDAALAIIREQVLLVSTDTVPQHLVEKTLGFIESKSGIEAASDSEYQLAEKEALLSLGRQALSMGANAVVGLHKVNSHYDQAGSQWRIARVSYLGTAVLLR